MDDKLYNRLKNKWKDIVRENYNILDELSTASDYQDEPSWNIPSFDKKILKSKPLFTFEHDFKELGIATVGLFKSHNYYIFINMNNSEKIAEIEFKKIDILYNGKIHKGCECSDKVLIISKYRGKGFSYILYDTIIRHNNNNPGIWISDTKVTPVNKIVWKKLITVYTHDFLISNGRTPPLWIQASDRKNIEKYRLNYYTEKIKSDPDSIWSENFDTERIRIILIG